MEIYNKGSRDIIIAREDLISLKGSKPEESKDALNKKYFHIQPEMVCEVKNEVALDLIKRYPKEIWEWGKSNITR